MVTRDASLDILQVQGRFNGVSTKSHQPEAIIQFRESLRAAEDEQRSRDHLFMTNGVTSSVTALEVIKG